MTATCAVLTVKKLPRTRERTMIAAIANRTKDTTAILSPPLPAAAGNDGLYRVDYFIRVIRWASEQASGSAGQRFSGSTRRGSGRRGRCGRLQGGGPWRGRGRG